MYKTLHNDRIFIYISAGAGCFFPSTVLPSLKKKRTFSHMKMDVVGLRSFLFGIWPIFRGELLVSGCVYIHTVYTADYMQYILQNIALHSLESCIFI